MVKNIEINIKGSDGNYEVLYPKTNSSTSVVSEEVITNLGLIAGSSGNDVLKWFSQYNLYWWRRRVSAYSEYTPVADKYIYNAVLTGDSRYSDNYTTILYSKEVYYDTTTQKVALKNPQSMTLGAYTGNRDKQYQDAEKLKNLAPVYIVDNTASNLKVSSNPKDANPTSISSAQDYVIYLPDGVSCNNTSDSDSDYFTATINVVEVLGYGGYYRTEIYGGSRVWNYAGQSDVIQARSMSYTTTYHYAGDWEYIQSSNRNAYPDSGTQDGYEYKYLGVPYQQMSQTPNGILIGTFQINKTAFGGTKLFDSTEIEAGCGYYFTVDYDIEWKNNSGKSIQIGLMITSESSSTIFDTSGGFCYNVSYGYQTTTGQEQGSSRIYYVNNAKDIFLCLHADTSAYDCNFLSTGIYFNFAGPNLTTSQLNNITISKANFTVKVYKQVLC